MREIKFRDEREILRLLEELDDIQSQCIGELAMGYKLDAQSIGESISKATGMTNPELKKYLLDIKRD